MSLAELVSEEDLLLDFAPADKWEAIRLLVDHVVAREKIERTRRAEILEAVVHRERALSTGLEHGIAIPHAAVEGLDRVQAAVGITQNEAGVLFETVDGLPVRIVVLLLIPSQQRLLHIRTLKEVALALERAEVRSALYQARTPREAHQALVGTAPRVE